MYQTCCSVDLSFTTLGRHPIRREFKSFGGAMSFLCEHPYGIIRFFAENGTPPFVIAEKNQEVITLNAKP